MSFSSLSWSYRLVWSHRKFRIECHRSLSYDVSKSVSYQAISITDQKALKYLLWEVDQRPCRVGWVAVLYNYQQNMVLSKIYRSTENFTIAARFLNMYLMVPNAKKTPKLRSMQCNTPFLLTGWQILQCSRCVCMICIAILHSRQRLLGWSIQVKCRSSNVLLH